MSSVTDLRSPASQYDQVKLDIPKKTEDEITYRKVEGEYASKIDRLFGIEGCLIEVNPGRVFLPPAYKEIGQRIRNLRVRPDDVWVISFPRTGSTWAQEMVWCIGHDVDLVTARKLVQNERTPMLELTALMGNETGSWKAILPHSVNMVEDLPSPRYIKSHLPLTLLPREFTQVKPKVIYCARNPKDMCVSYYHYCMLVHDLHGTFEDFCQLFLVGRVPIGNIWDHILGFWQLRNDENVLFLKYEDMKRDLASVIERTSKFLNKSLTAEQVTQLLDHLSFESMKKNPAVNLDPFMSLKHGEEFSQNPNLPKFIRKGQVGDYKNHMSPEIVAQFDIWTEENLRGTGLSFE